jgi:multicomponent Na+:H+ antiporter subunit F
VTAAAILHWATSIALGLLLLALLLALLRLVRGPTLADRILALDLMTTLALSFVAVIALRTGFTLYLDIAIAIALAGFLATVALARYLLQRGGSEASETMPETTP